MKNRHETGRNPLTLKLRDLAPRSEPRGGWSESTVTFKRQDGILIDGSSSVKPVSRMVVDGSTT